MFFLGKAAGTWPTSTMGRVLRHGRGALFFVMWARFAAQGLVCVFFQPCVGRATEETRWRRLSLNLRGLHLVMLVLSGPVRDTPPYRAIPFRDSIAERGVSRPSCLVFTWYRAGIAEIPPFWGDIASPLCMLSKRERLRKGGGGYRTEFVTLRHPKPHSSQ